MSDPHSVSEGGLALDAAGKIKDIPHKLVSTLSDDLLDVVTLLHALKAEAYKGYTDTDADDDNMTSSSSRATALVYLIDGKVRELLTEISPYV